MMRTHGALVYQGQEDVREGSIVARVDAAAEPMWAEEFRAILAEIGGSRYGGSAEGSVSWSARGLAERVGESEVEVRRWEAGEKHVREDVAAWLRRRLAARRALPPPDLDGVRAERGAGDGPEPRERYRKNRDGSEDSGERAAARARWLKAAKDETASRARRLKAAMDQLGWRPKSLAGFVGRPHTTVRTWVLGERAIPLELVEWVEAVAESDAADPPPAKVLPGGVRAADVSRMRSILGAWAKRAREEGDPEAASSVERGVLLLEKLPDLLGPRAPREPALERPRAAEGVERAVYPEGEPMGPEELRAVQRELGLGGDAALDLIEHLEGVITAEDGEGRDMLAWLGITRDRLDEARSSLSLDRMALVGLLDWPGMEARKFRRMASPTSGVAVPGPVAGWLRAAAAEMRAGRPLQAWAILKRPPEIPPKSEWTWMRREKPQAAQAVPEPEPEAAYDPVRELLGDPEDYLPPRM